MKDRPSIAMGPSKPLSMELRRVWDVRQGRSYDVKFRRTGTDLIAIRTLAGEGELWIEGRDPMLLAANSLILLEAGRVRRYRCVGDVWGFWWFEFGTSDPLPCALGKVYSIGGAASDADDFKQVFSKLQGTSYPARCVASATFASMFHRWLLEARLEREASPHRQVIEGIIERIHADVAADWPLVRLSKESGLCETLFRREFRKAAGKGPAQFIREARLQAAAQLIQQGIYTLAAIAEMTNFSSAFHLSASFKKHFGASPSGMRS